MSKCHIVGNLMPRLSCDFPVDGAICYTSHIITHFSDGPDLLPFSFSTHQNPSHVVVSGS